MKTSHLSLLTITAAILASCAPTPTPLSGGPNPPTNGEVPAPQAEATTNVPTGRPSPDGKKNMIISPYKPYNLIDVSGYKSGDIVGDPSTASLDTNGKPVLKTSKHFRLP